MYKVLISVLSFFISSFFYFNYNFKLKTRIDLEIEPIIFRTDNLGFIYVSDNILLRKYNLNGELIKTYSDDKFLDLQLVDATDPFKILLYYKNSNKIIFLDKNLAKIGNEISLDKLNYFAVKSVCKSKQYAIWIFDEFENKLIQYCFNPNRIIHQISMDNFTTGDVSISEQGNYVAVISNKSSVYIFNDNGLFIDSLNLKGKNIFQIKGENIIYNEEKNVYSYNFIKKETKSFKFDKINDFEELRIENDNLYVTKGKSIFIYSMNLKE
ncbi:MAG: hypothetical protein JXR51_04365 [Bacteroidales bacterium]|nr:hypothetical protein [Bacteroidales bacterium]MBN2756390.1 hypothetical protein [Bacteroidales bacterium]